MKQTTAIIIGSSRSNGNTRIVVDYYKYLVPDCHIFDLNDYKIGYYDYEFNNVNDDFIKLYKELLKFDTLVFATPIYWYTMSAQMKTFFDRISDMLHKEYKVLGRMLQGKTMAVISCGSNEEIFEGFDMPFRESANYLGMNYLGHIHTWVINGNTLDPDVINGLKKLV